MPAARAAGIVDDSVELRIVRARDQGAIVSPLAPPSA